jgi:hypothetical protein
MTCGPLLFRMEGWSGRLRLAVERDTAWAWWQGPSPDAADDVDRPA